MHFENENLDSIKQEKEFEITLRSMLAQDESRNISENIFIRISELMTEDIGEKEVDQATMTLKKISNNLEGII